MKMVLHATAITTTTSTTHLPTMLPTLPLKMLEYQFEMMRCLRDVNIDSNTVGWYQSTFLGSYLTQAYAEGRQSSKKSHRSRVAHI
jgi:hypothetical protein